MCGVAEAHRDILLAIGEDQGGVSANLVVTALHLRYVCHVRFCNSLS